MHPLARTLRRNCHGPRRRWLCPPRTSAGAARTTLAPRDRRKERVSNRSAANGGNIARSSMRQRAPPVMLHRRIGLSRRRAGKVRLTTAAARETSRRWITGWRLPTAIMAQPAACSRRLIPAPSAHPPSQVMTDTLGPRPHTWPAAHCHTRRLQVPRRRALARWRLRAQFYRPLGIIRPTRLHPIPTPCRGRRVQDFRGK
jgi:hypothetical protein